jgi:hypothetical protein
MEDEAAIYQAVEANFEKYNKRLTKIAKALETAAPTELQTLQAEKTSIVEKLKNMGAARGEALATYTSALIEKNTHPSTETQSAFDVAKRDLFLILRNVAYM